MNSVKISGNLTSDPEIRTYTVTEQQEEKTYKRASFVLANNIIRGRRQDKGAFVRCIAFKKQAEIIEEYLHKGDGIIVEGHLTTGQYDKNNVTVYTTDLFVENIEFLTSTKGGEGETIGNTNDFESMDEGLPSPF